MTLLLPLVVLQALQAAAPAGARVDVTSYRATSACEPERAEVRGALKGSGSIAVRIGGRGCGGWALADARVTAQVLVAAKAARAGEPLEASLEWREVRAGHDALTELPRHAVAAQDIARGQIIEAQAVREAGPAPGAAVRVVILDGALSLEQQGRAAPCVRGRACATLPNGKHVEGTFSDGAIVVEAR